MLCGTAGDGETRRAQHPGTRNDSKENEPFLALGRLPQREEVTDSGHRLTGAPGSGDASSEEFSPPLWPGTPPPPPQSRRLLGQCRPRVGAVNHRPAVSPAWSPASGRGVRRAKPAPLPRNSLLWKHFGINTPNKAENTLTPNPRGLLISLRI